MDHYVDKPQTQIQKTLIPSIQICVPETPLQFSEIDIGAPSLSQPVDKNLLELQEMSRDKKQFSE